MDSLLSQELSLEEVASTHTGPLSGPARNSYSRDSSTRRDTYVLDVAVCAHWETAESKLNKIGAHTPRGCLLWADEL